MSFESDAAFHLAFWASGLRLADLPSEIRLAAKHCLRDVIGVALAASSHPTVTMAGRHAGTVFASGKAQTVLGGLPLAAPGAALVNATAAHVLDFDDTCFDGIVHASAAVWPAVQAVADMTNASGAELLTAFIAGVEVEYAIGRALTDDLYYRGWWNSGLLGTVGAAAGAARVLGLDAPTSAHALRLAAGMSGGIRSVFGASSKPVGLGRASRAGVEAALLAQAGLVSSSGLFESPNGGFAATLNGGIWKQEEISKIGRHFSLISPGIAFKSYPACSATQAAVEATLLLLNEAACDSASIVSAACTVTPLVAACLTYDRPSCIEEAQFSLPFAVGTALAKGQFDVSCLSEHWLKDAGLQAAMQKVTMTADESLSGGNSNYPEAADVTLTFASGSLLKKFLGAATGMPTRPMSQDRLEAKFKSCTQPLLGDHSETLLSLILEIERLQIASDLWNWRTANVI